MCESHVVAPRQLVFFSTRENFMRREEIILLNKHNFIFKKTVDMGILPCPENPVVYLFPFPYFFGFFP